MITIPVSPELMHHPKTRALARLTSLPRANTWPKLILFWSYAARYYPAGDVTNLKDDPAELAFALEFSSPDEASVFFAAMLSAGFLDRDAAGRLTIHDWFTQGPGRLLRKQAADRARKRLRAVSAEFPRNIQTACRNPTSDPRNPIYPEKPGNTLPSRAKAKDTCEAGVPWLFQIPDTRNPTNPVSSLKYQSPIPVAAPLAAQGAAPRSAPPQLDVSTCMCHKMLNFLMNNRRFLRSG